MNKCYFQYLEILITHYFCSIQFKGNFVPFDAQNRKNKTNFQLVSTIHYIHLNFEELYLKNIILMR